MCPPNRYQMLIFLHSFRSSITEQRRMKSKVYQDKYLCFGIIFNHAKLLKYLTCQFFAMLFSMIFFIQCSRSSVSKHRKNDLIEVKQIAYLKRSIPYCSLHGKCAWKLQVWKNILYLPFRIKCLPCWCSSLRS